MLRIGQVTLDEPLVLAPMAGVTDRDFRLLVRRIGGVGLVTMEFLPSRGIVGGIEKILDKMHFVDEERPLSIQIYGSDVETMTRAAEIVQELGPDLCDINMGCPANKVLKGCAGAALMGDLPLAERMIASVRRVLSIPLTVKFRLGLRETEKSYLELGRICEANGVDAVAMHARTAKQKFSGRADWEEIARLKEALTIPVLGNGDVTEPEDAERMMAETGCDGVLIARAATKNPWIFRQTAARRAGAEIVEPTIDDRRRLIMGHFRMVAEREADAYALHKLRKFTGWYTWGLPHGRKLRHQINSLPDVPSFLQAVEEFFDGLDQLEQAA
ncbi:MAG: tRNA dihydrouridine synthase DusB [Thermoanaerobaculia bacterium]|nr:tRNA dihydrouridine synthase DusB [Thermoanaerobaculia bacterium]